MGKVVFNMTMSLDGFVAGPNDGPENGLGDGGDALFRWYFSGDTEISVGAGSPLLKVSAQSAKLLKEAMATYGAGVWGRRTFDIARAWGGQLLGFSRRDLVASHNAGRENRSVVIDGCRPGRSVGFRI
jgi:hypothetical protein